MIYPLLEALVAKCNLVYSMTATRLIHPHQVQSDGLLSSVNEKSSAICEHLGF